MRAEKNVARLGRPLDKMYVTEWLHQESNRFVRLLQGKCLKIRKKNNFLLYMELSFKVEIFFYFLSLPEPGDIITL